MHAVEAWPWLLVYKPSLLAGPSMVFAKCTSPVCTSILVALSLTRSCWWFAAGGPQLIPKCSNYRNNISWFRQFRIDHCYHCSINCRFVSGTGHPSPAPARNLCTAMFNKPSVNQKLVIQGLFAFSFPCNEVFD